MKKFSYVLCAATMTLLCHSTRAADWQYAAGSDTTFYNMDFDSVATVNGYRKAWVKANYTEEQKTNGYPVKSYRSQMLLYYFDCKAKTLNATQSVLYAKFNAAGDVIESRSVKFDPKSLDDAVPGSIGEALLNVACGSPAARAKIKAKNDAETREYLKAVEERSRRDDKDASSGT